MLDMVKRSLRERITHGQAGQSTEGGWAVRPIGVFKSREPGYLLCQHPGLRDTAGRAQACDRQQVSGALTPVP